MHVSTDEQETVIQFGRNDNGATIYTSDSTIMTKLDKQVKNSDYYTLIRTDTCDGDTVSKTYHCKDKKLISFRSAKTKRVLTDEQKKAGAERLARARAERKIKGE